MTQFQDLGLLPELQTALAEKNYVEATAIQTQAIPVVLSGKDLMASAQTGTGKTAAFVLPILQRLNASGATRTANRTQVLIITPTRELAAQIYENVLAYSKYLDIRAAVVFGGVNINPQMKTLRGGVDILVATPGRLLDLVGQNAVKLDQVSIFVLDEADRMLDMGFIPDVKRIQGKLPARRHNLMFSATFSDPIRKLAKTMLTDPVEIDVAPRNTTAQNIQQVVHPVDKKSKTQLLIHLIRSEGWRQVLVFSRTKHGANKLVKELLKAGIQSDAIHGNKSQGARTRALAGFKDGLIDILVATDIAARGIDIAALPRVVNFDLPNVPEDYVHRIGRTARAGSSGAAVSLVAADEFKQLRDIERLILKPIERVEVEGFEPDHQVPESGSIPSRPRNNPRQGAPARQGGRNQNSQARAARPKSAGNSQGNSQGASDQSSGNRANGNVQSAPPKKSSPNRTRSFSPSGRGRPAVNGNR
ncbi:DEAD/DEAH box helicase [Pseudomonadales bacterium]|nr:DEAD/DEAH box helicase [Pseudomonadales bacterium]